MVDNREYGLVLAGGGTKGAYQVGVWKALKELKINKSIPIDFNKYLKKLLPEGEIQDLKKYINKNKYLKNFKDDFE